MNTTPKSQPLSASLEDYLEAILNIHKARGSVRTKDIAERLNVSPPSVTYALHQLTRRKLINHEPYRGIRLTDQGQAVAEEVARKHRVLKTFFTDVLAVKEKMADECACRMEHTIPDEVLERFIAYIQFEERCHQGGTDWIEGTGFVCHTQADQGGPCEQCSSFGNSCDGQKQEPT
jgi:DtxR family transcriptional regulator, Mn-dependent transcriptional regulator